jgi:colanic acid/amylovoran biosynthesis glycosyltransferase
MTNMRIGYLTGLYPRATDTFIQREVMALREKGVEVQTFSIRRPGDEHIVGPEQKNERDRTFYILPANPIVLLLAHLTLLLSGPGRYLNALKLAWSTRSAGLKGNLYQLFYFLEAGILAKQIRDRNIQHLHNHIAEASCTVAMLAAALGGFTYSFTIHGPYIFFEPYRWRLDAKIDRALFVCCISHFCRSQTMLFAPMNRWERMHIIHCGVNLALFNLVSHDRPSQNLLYVGRLAANKGLPILLQSLASLKTSHADISLTVVGDGPDRAELEKMTEELGLVERVKFIGYQSQAEVRQHLQQTDVFVLPSFAEGVPVVLMEAMAAGIPVVATQIAGVSELVEDGISGYLVPPGDPDSLAKRIELLLSDRSLRAKFGASGRLKVENDFDISQEVDRLYLVMSSALQGKVEAIRPNVTVISNQ